MEIKNEFTLKKCGNTLLEAFMNNASLKGY